MRGVVVVVAAAADDTLPAVALNGERILVGDKRSGEGVVAIEGVVTWILGAAVVPLAEVVTREGSGSEQEHGALEVGAAAGDAATGSVGAHHAEGEVLAPGELGFEGGVALQHNGAGIVCVAVAPLHEMVACGGGGGKLYAGAGALPCGGAHGVHVHGELHVVRLHASHIDKIAPALGVCVMVIVAVIVHTVAGHHEQALLLGEGVEGGHVRQLRLGDIVFVEGDEIVAVGQRGRIDGAAHNGVDGVVPTRAEGAAADGGDRAGQVDILQAAATHLLVGGIVGVHVGEEAFLVDGEHPFGQHHPLQAFGVFEHAAGEVAHVGAEVDGVQGHGVVEGGGGEGEVVEVVVGDIGAVAVEVEVAEQRVVGKGMATDGGEGGGQGDAVDLGAIEEGPLPQRGEPFGQHHARDAVGVHEGGVAYGADGVAQQGIGVALQVEVGKGTATDAAQVHRGVDIQVQGASGAGGVDGVDPGVAHQAGGQLGYTGADVQGVDGGQVAEPGQRLHSPRGGIVGVEVDGTVVGPHAGDGGHAGLV